MYTLLHTFLRHVIRNLSTVVAVVSCVVALVAASPGFARSISVKAEVLWQDLQDGGSGADDSASAIAASSERLYVAGHLSDPYSSTRFTVRSYDARIGNLLWQDISAAGRAVDIAVNGGRVLVAGHRAATQPGGAFLLRAYNARHGELLWQDQAIVHPPPDVETDEALDNIAHALAAKHDRVFVVGWAGKGLVRAYHVHDGKLLWEDGSEGTFTTWRTVDTDGKRVFVGGQASPTEGLLSSVVLRALDARTGEQIWENRWNETSILAGAKALARQGWRIVLVGTVLDEEGKWNFTVRVYHAATGRLLWEQMHDDTGNDDNDTDFARAVAMHGDRLFAAGTLGDDFAVLGYDIRSGAFLWENRYDSGFIGAASDICVRDGQVYAAGFTDLFLNQTYLVRVLDTYNGSMLWEDRAEGIGNEHASAIEAIGRLVYVSGTTHSVSTGRDFTVRAYRQERTIHPTDRQ